ncbi:MAG: acylglycerol kinase family protein, partial [Lachnospiraceae bacterium]|nr:acylglycerol kinase family protein [Lachnospiraceae bacterium]
MIYFIVNGTARSGEGLNIWKQVRSHLKRQGVVFKAFETKYEGHATILAEKICKLPSDEITLVTIGGDGTINEVLNGITDFKKIRFGVIPTGSGNDFARGLNISKDPLLQADIITNSIITENIDMGKVWWEGCDKPRYF